MRECGDEDSTASGGRSFPRPCRFASPHPRISSSPLHQLEPVPERIVHMDAVEAGELLGGGGLVGGGLPACDEWRGLTDEERGGGPAGGVGGLLRGGGGDDR